MKFVWTDNFDEIPRYLVDQIKNKDFSTDGFYAYNKATKNPFKWLILIKQDDDVIGFCWGILELLTKAIFINNISLDKRFQNKGIMKMCLGEIDRAAKKIGVNKITSIGNRSSRAIGRLNFRNKGIYYQKEL